MEGLRQVKDTGEVRKIREATRIAIAALNFIQKQIVPGRTEIEIAGEIERFIRYQGGYSSSFEIIVASGENSAYPHHVSSERKIRNQEVILIDMGVDYQGYKSDLTRVFFLGKINTLTRNIYALVRNAQAEAIRKIKPGRQIKEVDAASRQLISGAGYGDNFSHNLGHGIGLEIHEAPQICAREGSLLEEGMIFTVEPGVYLPGKFGIRIEDMVLVTRKGVELLSGSLNQ